MIDIPNAWDMHICDHRHLLFCLRPLSLSQPADPGRCRVGQQEATWWALANLLFFYSCSRFFYAFSVFFYAFL